MKITETEIEGLIILEPIVYGDDRGYFMESYNKKFDQILGVSWYQDNESMSNINTVRGLHYQKGVYAQAKLVRVITGSVIDSVVDLRLDSKTYGKSFSILLSGNNKKQLYIPRGFAHGFSVLSNNTIFNYKCDNVYKPEAEAGINPFDPDLNINWIVKEEDAILSKRDKSWSNLCEIQK
jgi:dTDP-4-dehydrorhamnose 3,5-epimerase